MALSLLLTACSRTSPELTDIAAGGGEPSEAAGQPAADSSTTLIVDVTSTSLTSSETDDVEEPTSAEPGTTTTSAAAPAEETTVANGTNDTTTDGTGSDNAASGDSATEELAVLGPASSGVGEFVFLAEPRTNPDNECVKGRLGYRINDQSDIHVYDQPETIGFTRHFPGPQGHDAFVSSCEESIEQVLIAASQPGTDQAPPLQLYWLGEPWTMGFTQAEIGWRHDLFVGWASYRPASTDNLELVLFDTESESIMPVVQKLGEWQSMWDFGYDYVIPDSWEASIDASIGLVQMRSADETVTVDIEPLSTAGELDPPADAPGDAYTGQIGLWAVPDRGAIASHILGMQERVSFEWQTPSGTVAVDELRQAARPLRVTISVNQTAPRGTETAAFIVADLLRNHAAAG